MAEERAERRLSAILAADVVGYSRLVEADEAATLAAFKGHLDDLIAPAITDNRGRVVKTMGDGVLAEFQSVVDAVLCARALQDGMAARNAEVAEDRRLRFRIGINVGDIVIDGDDIQGDGVNVAARMEGLAEPGGICISGTVHDHVHGKVDAEFQDLGDQEVKNLARAVRAYRVAGDGGDTAVTRKPRWRIPAIAAAIAVAIAAGLGWWQPWAPDVEPASIDKMAFKLPDKPSIAVLQFANISGDKEQEYFADGLTEDIITSLASFPNLFVIARNSTAKFKGKAVDIRDVAHDLGVRYVLEGSVRRADNTLRITAQLIDALSGNHIWAKSYDRELKDIFALQDEIIGEIGSRLVSKVETSEWKRSSRKGTQSVEAYDLFLLGWEAFQEFNPRSSAKAIRLLEQAIELDPGYARAYGLLALTRRYNVRFKWGKGPKDTLEHAFELAQKAVALDPSDAQTHRILSNLYHARGQNERSIEEAEKAVALGPSNPDAIMGLAYALAFAGHGEAAVRHAEAAMRLDPHARWSYPLRAGFAYYMARQFDKAARAFESSLRLSPRN
jgi:TolB-like protein/class 3 adenylate cyclase/Tfp pilus assembly protein PilF